MLRLHNTLTRAEEQLQPAEDMLVRLYTCGPTVYDYAHIGNFRTFVFQDLLCRYLRYRGYQVRHVMNITDVDDRIIQNSKALGIPLKEYTTRYTEAFLEDSRKLRILPPDIMPLATDHIPEMVQLIRRLEERGYTYRRDASIYFSISRFPEYGKLSKQDFSGIQPGARVDADRYEKDEARDFVLWKAAKEGEPFWETEVGPGRPGWHIECSAMSMHLLGETFDIHTGGVDNIFPHHENEIAQSEAATGRPFVRYWMHAAHLIVDGEKMSKSKGNFHTLRDLAARGHDMRAVRYMLLSVHYRKPLNFTFEGLSQAAAALGRVDDLALRLDATAQDLAADGGEVAARATASLQGLTEALDDDLNTAGALGHLFDLVRETHSAMDAGRFGTRDLAAARQVQSAFETIFGIRAGQRADLNAEIEGLIRKRGEARSRRDFAAADRIRDELLGRGIILEDTPQGVRWKRKGA